MVLNKQHMELARDTIRDLDEFDSFMQMESFILNEELESEANQIVKESVEKEEALQKETDWDKLYNS